MRLLAILAAAACSAALSASASPDDSNAILNAGLDPNIFQRLGQYSPRFTVPSSVEEDEPPSDCRIVQVTSLERHGARHFTASALSAAQSTLSKLQTAIAASSNKQPSAPVRFLANATLSNTTDDLLPYGALQAWYSGRASKATYGDALHTPPFVRSSGSAEVGDDRVVLTSQYWRLGYSGGKFPANLRNAADVRAYGRTLAAPDVTLSEQKGTNNTLDVKTCAAEEDRPSTEGEDAAQAAYLNSTVLPTVGARLMRRLAERDGVHVELSGTDIVNLANMCSFETYIRATITDAKPHFTPVFCDIFHHDDWAVLGYTYDVGKWAGAGYGDPYYKALGSGYARELVARLTNERPALSPPMSINTTLDADAATFPIDDGRVYLDTSHDNNIGPIAAALGLFYGPALRTDTDAERRRHAWRFAHIAPLQGKIVMEKWRCDDDEQAYVRVRANEATQRVRHAWCPGGRQRLGALCPLDALVRNLSFAQDGSEWAKCDDAAP